MGQEMDLDYESQGLPLGDRLPPGRSILPKGPQSQYPKTVPPAVDPVFEHTSPRRRLHM